MSGITSNKQFKGEHPIFDIVVHSLLRLKQNEMDNNNKNADYLLENEDCVGSIDVPFI